jgi:hypothetical protein
VQGNCAAAHGWMLHLLSESRAISATFRHHV